MREVEERTGVHNWTLSLVERNKQRPSERTLARLAELYQLDLGEFLDLVEGPDEARRQEFARIHKATRKWASGAAPEEIVDRLREIAREYVDLDAAATDKTTGRAVLPDKETRAYEHELMTQRVALREVLAERVEAGDAEVVAAR